MVNCVFIEVETEDTLFEFVYCSLVAKRHQHLLMSMDPTKGTKQVYYSTMYKYETHK